MDLIRIKDHTTSHYGRRGGGQKIVKSASRVVINERLQRVAPLSISGIVTEGLIERFYGNACSGRASLPTFRSNDLTQIANYFTVLCMTIWNQLGMDSRFKCKGTFASIFSDKYRWACEIQRSTLESLSFYCYRDTIRMLSKRF